jgi:hypothetical protein
MLLVKTRTGRCGVRTCFVILKNILKVARAGEQTRDLFFVLIYFSSPLLFLNNFGQMLCDINAHFKSWTIALHCKNTYLKPNTPLRFEPTDKRFKKFSPRYVLYMMYIHIWYILPLIF